MQDIGKPGGYKLGVVTLQEIRWNDTRLMYLKTLLFYMPLVITEDVEGAILY